MATGDAPETIDVSTGAACSSGSGRRKRPVADLAPEACSTACGPPGPRGDYEKMATFQALTQTQRAIIRKVVDKLDTERDSVVITNPLQPQGPIVYVTNAWQDMCGYNMQQAVGQNPRLTQGEGTDPDTVKTMKLALGAQQPCRVRIINYRGYNREPFWNCLSVQPIFFNRELVLFAARLQDYSHRMAPLMSLKPAQFCKTGDLFQMRVRLPELRSAKALAHPRHIDVTPSDLGWGEADGGHAGAATDAGAAEATISGFGAGGPSANASAMPPPRHVKRLAFGGLELEPEYLLDRLRHECAELNLPCQSQEVRVNGAEVMRMEVASAPPAASTSTLDAGEGSSSSGAAVGAASSSSSNGGGTSGAALSLPSATEAGGGLRALVHVMPEGNEDGTYAISLMRLVGDTFEFHALYRQLRDRLTDITVSEKRQGLSSST